MIGCVLSVAVPLVFGIIVYCKYK